ncbi:hypothetical protein SDC9_130602 [bioreactor metagenome]|uniref:Uncharacterized protein n=1 Tax=bioreactor metagenome TaxID=1076179 RepID=A0A645D393_9ZZZZ|nr:hypothetical protein [Rikenellaceae bacterium]
MDLEQLKAEWQELSKRVEKYETLNQQNTINMLQTRTISTKGKMEKYEIIFFAISVFYAIFLSCALFINTERLIANETIMVGIGVFVVAGAWQLYKILLLQKMKIDRCSVIELQKRALRYKALTLGRLIGGMILLIPTLLLFYYFQRDLMPQELLLVTSVGAFFGLAIGLKTFFSQWSNINQLITDLKELKHLDSSLG